jgi:hypothetical protein
MNETIGLWDVIAIDIKTGKHRMLEPAKTYENAEAVMNMAIMRRGVETEFYKLRPHRLATKSQIIKVSVTNA